MRLELKISVLCFMERAVTVPRQGYVLLSSSFTIYVSGNGGLKKDLVGALTGASK